MQLLGWYESDDNIHIAMEYISLGNLRNYLEDERSESEAKVVTQQLLEGLVVIHEEGFAHRDLKPEVRSSSRCKQSTDRAYRTSSWSPNLPCGLRLEILGWQN